MAFHSYILLQRTAADLRDTVDSQASALSSTTLSRINALSSSLPTASSSPISSWIPFYDDSDEKRHKEALLEMKKSVIWLLEQKLLDVSNIHKKMMESRLAYNLKKQEMYDFSLAKHHVTGTF